MMAAIAGQPVLAAAGAAVTAAIGSSLFSRLGMHRGERRTISIVMQALQVPDFHAGYLSYWV
ncbi:MAG: hypothetical protein AB7S39_20560 [Gemmatimonadales bacterium]